MCQNSIEEESKRKQVVRKMRDQMKVFLGVSGTLIATYLATTSFGSKKKGHGLFDVEK